MKSVSYIHGIGGYYLCAASAIEMLNGLFSDSKVKIIFMGNTFSSTYTAQVLKLWVYRKY